MKNEKVKTSEEISFNEVREMVRKEIEKRYGGVAKFLKTKKGKELGGMRIKIYLYDVGPVNFGVISSLCEYLGLGEFTRELVVSRSFSYYLNKTTPDDKKLP